MRSTAPARAAIHSLEARPQMRGPALPAPVPARRPAAARSARPYGAACPENRIQAGSSAVASVPRSSGWSPVSYERVDLARAAEEGGGRRRTYRSARWSLLGPGRRIRVGQAAEGTGGSRHSTTGAARGYCGRSVLGEPLAHVLAEATGAGVQRGDDVIGNIAAARRPLASPSRVKFTVAPGWRRVRYDVVRPGHCPGARVDLASVVPRMA
jgi:hypothetical protein